MAKILFVNEGFASFITGVLFNKFKKVVHKYVLPIIFRKYKYEGGNWNHVQSTLLRSKKWMREFITLHANKSNELTYVGKSYGCYEFIRWLLGKYKKDGKKVLSKYKSVKVFLIDPNPGETRKTGIFDIRGYVPSNMKVYAYHQEKNTPYGFRVLGANANTVLTKEKVNKKPIDHFNIIQCKKVLNDIRTKC